MQNESPISIVVVEETLFELEPKVVKSRSLFQTFVSGGIGGVFFVIVGHPFDTVKVRLQTMSGPIFHKKSHYTGAFKCFYKIFKSEGVSGLYKGMGLPLLSVAPIYALYFVGFTFAKNLMVHDKDISYTPAKNFLAGSFAGLLTTFLTVPSERIKCLLQVQKGWQKPYKGPLDCFLKLYRKGGFFSIYRGTLATVIRDVPSGGLYFMTYEFIKNRLTNNGQNEITGFEAFIAGGCAGCSNWMIFMPADVVKTHMQTRRTNLYHKNTTNTFTQLWKKSGVKGFYLGLSAMLLRAFPANAACFFGFELIYPNILHSVKSKSVVTLAVNGVYSSPGVGDHRSASTDTGGFLFLGGHRLIHKARGLTVRMPYVGCIRNVQVNNVGINITPNMFEGQVTIGSCPTN